MLMGFSGVVDVLWLLIWGFFWNDTDYYPKGYWENTIHSFVLVLSIINLLIKVSLGVSVAESQSHPLFLLRLAYW